MTEETNGWTRFAAEYGVGDHLQVPISKIVYDIGLFCDLPAGVDGIVHLSDLDWEMHGEEVIGRFRVGDEVEVLVLAIQPDLQRVCLGIKHLRPRPPGRGDGPRGPEAGPVSSSGGSTRPPGFGGATKSQSDVRDA